MVYIASNGNAKEVKIETLTRTDKDVVVTSGIKAGDTLVVSGVMAIKNDSDIKVKIKESK